jgi:signal transduction histidine kinase
MPDPASLSEAFLEQGPGCNWAVGAGGEFLRVYGDAFPVFGKSAAELAGHTAAEALDSEAARVWRSRFARALAGETLVLRERRGESIWFIILFPIRVAGEPPLAGGTAREVTSWGAAEQDLRYTVLGALKAQEFERRMVSQFLHDKIGQNLTAFGLQLDLIRMDLESVSPATSARVVEMQQVLEGMMQEVREYSYELNPSTVERAGLRPALDRLTARIRGRFTGTLRVNADPSLKLDPKIASAMYHIAQEAVENAVQHSSCSAIEIAVKSTRAGSSLEVRDNGRGFDPADTLGACRGLGLLSMEHYAAQAGLDLSIKSDRETGTVVRALAPEPE